MAAAADLPIFKDGVNFEDWFKSAGFNLHLYLQWQRIPWILRALSQDLLSATIDAMISHDSDISQCCAKLVQFVINQLKQSFASEFHSY